VDVNCQSVLFLQKNLRQKLHRIVEAEFRKVIARKTTKEVEIPSLWNRLFALKQLLSLAFAKAAADDRAILGFSMSRTRFTQFKQGASRQEIQ